jgi:class 3 adenylate cyclase
MDYDRLTKAYWDQQAERVANLRQTIVDRGDAIAQGRLVPETADLVIGTGRQLDMAVMFLDLCGFSPRPSETLQEQEMLLRALNLFFTEMIKIAEEYGGVVEKNTGDGLMAYFNDGEGDPSETGCKRAVTCALTMMFANVNLINPIIRASNMEEFKFRIGIDYGKVTVSQLGAAKRFGSLVAVGTRANIACKMLSVASADEIIIGESVKLQLPIDWQTNYVKLKQEQTGWIYRATGANYRYYLYHGRWTPPK